MTYTITSEYNGLTYRNVRYFSPFPNICHASFPGDSNVRLHLTDLIHIQIK